MARGIGASIVFSSLLFLCFSYPPINAETTTEAFSRDLVIIDTVPHDSTSFTQGLEKRDGNLLESSGLYGHSRLSEINLQNGEIIRQISFEDSIFAEGITVRNNSVIMLTWREGTAFEIDLEDFSVIGNYSYEGEGWGICYNGEYLVMSNGSSSLTFRDPDTFEINHSLLVTFEELGVTNLNELECVGDTIYANVWMDDSILAINSSSGKVKFIVRTSSVSESQGKNANEVLNGIAYDESAGGFWITGKNWTEIYLVNFHESSNNTNSPDSSTTNSLILIVVGICIVFFFCFRILWRKDPETPNFKDHPQ
tara:strand:+ start:217 stop:1146 length:930 start_codon:yes stop_codon:yes gene_type:complete